MLHVSLNNLNRELIKFKNSLKTAFRLKNDLKVTYTIWIGDDVTDSNSINVRVPEGSKFIAVMEEAAKSKQDFIFEYKTYDFGRLITSIGGASENTEKNQYWMLYELSSKPDVDRKPTDKYLSNWGVDALDVRQSVHYLFWLKTVIFEN